MYLNIFEINRWHWHSAIVFFAVCRGLEAVYLAIALVPVSDHCWRNKTLKQVRNRWHVLSFLEQQLGCDPKNPVEARRAFRAHLSWCGVTCMIGS